ncbi:unannotated protein [freshwater metagenome]|uniref:Unannotated protein n=1 Tax=freshwater metagenome TaxID=449393 RepID=A0A6J5ZTP7_9ZZZZ|nr:AMP-binding protein [Actinomycetota bacterium]
MLVDAWLTRAAAATPHAPAVNNLSYAELLRESSRAARQLSALGVQPGDRVGIVLVPGVEFVIALHGVLLLGAVAVPVDPASAAPQIAERTRGARTVIDGPLTGHEDPAAVLVEKHDLDAVAVVIFSSGSTGAGKAVELTYGNFWWSAAGSAVALGLNPSERWLCCLPLSHVGGLSIVIRSAIYGTEAVVHERFDSERVLTALQSPDGPTIVSLVPTTLNRLLEAGLANATSLRWVLLGGGPISDQLLQAASSASIPVAPSYGMSEACSQIFTRGAPLFCTRVELGEDDEILVSGPTVAPQCRPTLHTGDLGRLADSGALEVVGRLSDLIISGGENVSPETVEAVVALHPAVADVAVVGRADEEWGQKVTAVVVLEPEMTLSAEDLNEFCSSRLSPHERPKAVEVRDSLGRSAAGKLRRRDL